MTAADTLAALELAAEAGDAAARLARADLIQESELLWVGPSHLFRYGRCVATVGLDCGDGLITWHVYANGSPLAEARGYAPTEEAARAAAEAYLRKPMEAP